MCVRAAACHKGAGKYKEIQVLNFLETELMLKHDVLFLAGFQITSHCFYISI